MGSIIFKCRACESDVSISLADISQGGQTACPNCKSELKVITNDSLIHRRVVTVCASCGHDMFYVQKDFNRTFGLVVVAAGVTISVYFLSRGEPMYAMGCLFLMAIADLLVYVMVRDVTVCYTCHSIYRGFERNPDHEPFDLKKLEKYGGRDPRLTRPRP